MSLTDLDPGNSRLGEAFNSPALKDASILGVDRFHPDNHVPIRNEVQSAVLLSICDTDRFDRPIEVFREFVLPDTDNVPSTGANEIAP